MVFLDLNGQFNLMQNIDEIEELVKLISKLPGLGSKSAKRIILKLIIVVEVLPQNDGQYNQSFAGGAAGRTVQRPYNERRSRVIGPSYSEIQGKS